MREALPWQFGLAVGALLNNSEQRSFRERLDKQGWRAVDPKTTLPLQIEPWLAERIPLSWNRSRTH